MAIVFDKLNVINRDVKATENTSVHIRKISPEFYRFQKTTVIHLIVVCRFVTSVNAYLIFFCSALTLRPLMRILFLLTLNALAVGMTVHLSQLKICITMNGPQWIVKIVKTADMHLDAPHLFFSVAMALRIQIFTDKLAERCDHKFRVKACGGHPEVEREPITRLPTLVPTYPPHTMKRHAKVDGYIPVSADPVLSCQGRSHGAYPLGKCLQQYLTCDDDLSRFTTCATGEVFDGLCVSLEKVSECKYPSTLFDEGLRITDCLNRQDEKIARGRKMDFIQMDVPKCPSSLVFNEKEGYCDYPGSCNGEIDDKSTGKVPMRTHPVGVQPLKSSSMSIDCEGRKDGYYSRGCSPEFVSCSEGIATYMKCPSSLVFNEKEGYCDYPGSCNGEIDDKSTGKVPMRTHPVGVQPLKSSSMSIDCEGRKMVTIREDVHLNSCLVKCPSSLVFNEKEGYCDYPGSCNGEIDDKSTGKVPMRTHPVGVQPLKSSSMSIDCEGKKDGYYSRGCSPEFVSCSEGIATYMKCPSSLVFNEKEGYCDYPGSCNGEVDDKSAGKVPMRTLPVGVQPLKSSSMSIDCEGKKDGYYSRGCSPEFVSCSEGIATYMKCPSSLVFNEKEGYCDYPGSCNSEVVDKSSRTSHSRILAVDDVISVSQVGCIASMALGKCMSKFKRCRNGRFISAQCPDPSLFDEKLLLCVYDLPDCRADRLSIVQYPADVSVSHTATPTTGSASMIPSDRSYAAETYFSESSNYGLSGKPLENLIAKSYLDHLPLNLYDPSNGRG
ncbi:chitin binding Peritrophin-A domain protein [Dictyocaulus viviparus]|uniref:Chitin binding Peritrophin-A domain protein n=1 Tax=Dictyocaulus viviparus TaxID=29172 RepID=A0A0D8XDJ2_DICVI|nr:chitin binding Peritrophin-A domain protein [Dictyocaulus viviparus]